MLVGIIVLVIFMIVFLYILTYFGLTGMHIREQINYQSKLPVLVTVLHTFFSSQLV